MYAPTHAQGAYDAHADRVTNNVTPNPSGFRIEPTLTAGIPFPEGRTAEWQFTNDTRGGGSSARMLIGTKALGGLNSVCEVNTSINRFPARALWLRLSEPRAKSGKG